MHASSRRRPSKDASRVVVHSDRQLVQRNGINQADGSDPYSGDLGPGLKSVRAAMAVTAEARLADPDLYRALSLQGLFDNEREGTNGRLQKKVQGEKKKLPRTWQSFDVRLCDPRNRR